MNITLLYIRNDGVTMRIIKNIDIGIFLEYNEYRNWL